MRRTLGVCYYPEQWEEARWPDDAAGMAAAGIARVRIGEFAWSRLEPAPGDLRFDWLDRAIGVLADAGLEVILGTPTATPPRWMLDRHPDMLAHDADGRPRRFGSRRHYCFSHEVYAAECERIAALLADRYGSHPAIMAWQIDNEYGCHETVLSYSPAAGAAFRRWLAARYGQVAALNAAWGNTFWSMEYDAFEQIDPPNLTVTEPNPAHVLAFRRFSSDQVVAFNARQAVVLRARTKAPLLHNYMGRVLAFDHFAVGADLEIAAWDSYPIGFLSDRIEAVPEHKARYLRQGDPDMQAFHHDLYRSVGAAREAGVSAGRWWVMEQQPGPVNWAPWNPAPLPGMVRLWTWEAFAHGAETVAYFRWRQAPVAQEQMHAGLQRPDGAPAQGMAEAVQVAAELREMPDVATGPAPVALIFDYASAWAWETQPQGADFDYFRMVFAWYRAARRLGLSLDLLPPDTGDLTPWSVVLAPGLAVVPEALSDALRTFGGTALLGPRTGAKTAEMAIPVPLPPALPGLDAVVAAVESLPPGTRVPLSGGGAFAHWVEHLEGDAEVIETMEGGRPALLGAGPLRYLAGWPDDDTLERLIAQACAAQGVETQTLPEGLRLRDAGPWRFAFNYGPDPVFWEGRTVPAAGVDWSRR